MKIAVVRRKIDQGGGGAERYAARLARWLSAGGHEVTLVCQQLEDRLRQDVERVVQLPSIRMPRWTKATAFARQSAEVVHSRHFDLVFGLSALPCSNLVRVSEGIHRHYLEKRYGNGWVASLQQMNPRHRALLQLEDQVFRAASDRRFIVQCQLDRFLLHNHFGLPDDRIRVLSNGVDTELYQPRSIERTGHNILFAAASNFRRKGLNELIQALAILRDSKSRLFVAGPVSASYQRLAVDWRVDDRVTFLGHRTDMQRVYATCDLTVAPSIYEPFPNVVLESIACGTPVVTTTTNGAAELIQDSVNGYLIGETHPRVIAESIESFLALDDAAQRSMREAARFTAVGHSWNDHFTQLAAVLSERTSPESLPAD